jgi:hypothetical protein
MRQRSALITNEENAVQNSQRVWCEDEPISSETLRPEDIGNPLAYHIAGHQRHAVLILDASGVIRFASTRQMFGRPDEDLSDTPLRSLVPTLPVRPSTPGYNIAYVRLTFADQNWRRFNAVSIDRGTFPVELSVRTLFMGRSYALLVAIREVPATRAEGECITLVRPSTVFHEARVV